MVCAVCCHVVCPVLDHRAGSSIRQDLPSPLFIQPHPSGTWWGLWNIGANLGGFLTPVVVGYVAKHYGWQWGMWAPAAAGLAVGFFTLAAVK